MMTVLSWLLLPSAVLLGWGFFAFNRGVRLKNQQAEAWSGIEVQLKKRNDLVPMMAECVRGYAKHEAAAVIETARLRTEKERVVAMREMIALAEKYPDLKASETFGRLMSDLVAIEDDLQYARRYYNGSVRDFRNFAESFPSLLIAKLFRFRPGEFFEVENVLERGAPNVNL